MNSSTSSSSRRLPRAFLSAAALILAGEILLGAVLPVDQGRHIVDRLLGRLTSPMPERDVVYWSDSVSYRILSETPLSAVTNDIASNKVIGLPGVYYTYERLLGSTTPPRYLYLALSPEAFCIDLSGPLTKTYFETCFTEWREIGDYRRTTGRDVQSARMAGYRLLLPPSLQRRGAVTRWMERSAKPLVIPERRRVIDPVLVREQLRERAAYESFVPARISELYLDKLTRRAAEDGTRVLLLTSALPRSSIEGWRRTGYLAQYEAWLAALARRHPNLTVEPADRFAVFADGEMRDQVHLNVHARRKYSHLLEKVIRESMD